MTRFFHTLGDKALALILPVLVLILWEVGSRLAFFPALLLPPPLQIFDTFVDLVRDGSLAANLKITLGRVIAGFILGTTAGFVLGTLMALSRNIDRTIGPLFHGIRQVPLYGWMPFLIICLGVGELFKVVFIAVGAFYPMVLNTYEGIKAVPDHYLEVGRVFEYKKFRLFRRIVLPAALPSIFTGIRLGLGLCWMLVIGAEFLASTTGIGYAMAWSRILMQSDVVIVDILVVGAIGFLMDWSIRSLEHRLLRWRNFTLAS